MSSVVDDRGKSSFPAHPCPGPHPRDTVRCECGLKALWMYERDPRSHELVFVAYQCPQHGVLTHDAIVAEKGSL